MVPQLLPSSPSSSRGAHTATQKGAVQAQNRRELPQRTSDHQDRNKREQLILSEGRRRGGFRVLEP